MAVGTETVSTKTLLLAAATELLRRDSARKSLLAYAQYINPTFKTPGHIRRIVEKLEAVERGEITRLMIFMPPRHGKSLIASQIFPAWFLGRNPTKSVITTSYSANLAMEFGRSVRNQLSSAAFVSAFGIGLSPESRSVIRFHTTQGGIYHATGVKGSLSGKGANLFILDDLVKNRQEAESPLNKSMIRSLYTSAIHNRLAPGGAIVIMNTRWCEDDICGWRLKEDAGRWDVLSLPAINEDKNEALWPEQYPLSVLREIERICGTGIGRRDWLSIYQQAPISDAGNVFKRSWWKYYESVSIAGFKRIVQSWDTAFETKKANDYSVCTTWGETSNGQYYLLDMWREKTEFPELKRAAFALFQKYKPQVVLIEKKASGHSLIQELKRETKMPVISVEVDKDKVSRATPVTSSVEAGAVFVPSSAVWLVDFLDEMSAFPSGAHDDVVDSCVHALEYMIRPQDRIGLLDFYAEQFKAGIEKVHKGDRDSCLIRN